MGLSSKKRLLRSALRVMDRMERDSKPYEIDVRDKRIKVLPGVFSPKYFTDSKFFATRLPHIVGERSFFEVGLGTGIVALFVKLAGSRYVAGSDINVEAILNTRDNFRRHRRQITARFGGILDTFGDYEKFDVIFWNHPYHKTDVAPRGMIQKSGMDHEYANLERYFRDAKKHLNPGGEVLLGTSNIASLRAIFALAKKHGYEKKLLTKGTAPFAKGSRQKIDLRIYSFRLQEETVPEVPGAIVRTQGGGGYFLHG